MPHSEEQSLSCCHSAANEALWSPLFLHAVHKAVSRAQQDCSLVHCPFPTDSLGERGPKTDLLLRQLDGSTVAWLQEDTFAKAPTHMEKLLLVQTRPKRECYCLSCHSCILVRHRHGLARRSTRGLLNRSQSNFKG